VNRGINHKRQRGASFKKAGLARAIFETWLLFAVARYGVDRRGTGEMQWDGAPRPGNPMHPGKDRIEIDGVPVRRSSKIYLALNKPRGVVTTAADEKARDSLWIFTGRFAVAGAGGPAGQSERRLAAADKRFGMGGADHFRRKRISIKHITCKSARSAMKS